MFKVLTVAALFLVACAPETMDAVESSDPIAVALSGMAPVDSNDYARYQVAVWHAADWFGLEAHKMDQVQVYTFTDIPELVSACSGHGACTTYSALLLPAHVTEADLDCPAEFGCGLSMDETITHEYVHVALGPNHDAPFWKVYNVALDELSTVH